MIAKLRATGGAGFDLAQPSHDRIYAAQQEYDIYKPLDLSKIDTSGHGSRACSTASRPTPPSTAKSMPCRTSGAPPA
jgi:hypothetical protein